MKLLSSLWMCRPEITNAKDLPICRAILPIFAATGTGGRAMESLIESGMVAGVLDLHDFAADEALLASIRQHAKVSIEEYDEEINSLVFARACAEKLIQLMTR